MDTTNTQQNLIAKRFELHFTIESHTSLIDALAVQTSASPQTALSKQQLKNALAKGCVWHKSLGKNQKVTRVRRVKKDLYPGDEISFYYDDTVLDGDIPAPVLVEDCRDFSIWYKPKGLLSQGSKWGDHSTIARWVETHQPFGKQRQVILIHRLDRATDGLIILAHTHQAAKLLTEAFVERKTTKIYQAGVWGKFPENTQTYQTPIDGRNAISHAKRLDYNTNDDISLLEVRIETGRKHQIRRHLSEAGFPIAGDRLHGDAERNRHLPSLDLMLTSVYLELALSGKTYQFHLPDALNRTRQDFQSL